MKAFNVANVSVKKAFAPSRRPHAVRRGSAARPQTSALPRSTPNPTLPRGTGEGVSRAPHPNPLSLSKSALHNWQGPLWPLSLSKERVRESFNDRISRSGRSGCGAAEFRPTSPTARAARGDLSLIKDTLGKTSRGARIKKQMRREGTLTLPSPARNAGEGMKKAGAEREARREGC
jgi:hypothetical protein